MEDNFNFLLLNGRGPYIFSTRREPQSILILLVNNSSGRNSLKVRLSNLAYPELGTAQPQLVFITSFLEHSLYEKFGDRNPLFAKSYFVLYFHHFILRLLILGESQIVVTDGVADRNPHFLDRTVKWFCRHGTPLLWATMLTLFLFYKKLQDFIKNHYSYILFLEYLGLTT